jgi:YD repeat-containing protein
VLNALGQRKEIIDPLGHVTKQDFDEAGRVKKVTDPLGGTTLTEYDAFGNAVKVTDPNGNSGFFFFDKANRNTWQVDPMGYATKTEYDGFGQAERITKYSGQIKGTLGTGAKVGAHASAAEATSAGSTAYVLTDAQKDATTTIWHDLLGRQTRIQDAEGHSEHMAYDGFDNKVSYTNKLGGVFSYTHDKLGRVLTETQPVTVKQHDAQGTPKVNPTPVQGKASTDWLVVTQFEYDSRGNVIKKTEAKGLAEQRVTEFGYDKLDRLTITRGQKTDTYTVSAGELKDQVPTETRQYDKRGNLIEVKAADGGITRLYWDKLNRQVGKFTSDRSLNGILEGLYESQVFDASGNAVIKRSAAARIHPLTPQQIQMVSSQGAMRTVRHVYDANNLLTDTYQDNITTGEKAESETSGYRFVTGSIHTARIHDRAGNVIKEIDGRGHATYSFYNALGQRVLQVDAARYVTQWAYDAAGNATSQSRYAEALPADDNAASWVLGTDTHIATILSKIPSPQDKRVQEFDFDRMGRKKEERTLNVVYSEVDALSGNLTEKTGTVRTRYVYDGQGNVTKRISATQEVTDLAYNQQGRLTRTQGAETAAWDNPNQKVRPTQDTEYNGLGQEVRSIQRGTDNAVETDDRITFYRYDSAGHRISETDPEGHVTEYAHDILGRTTRQDITRVDADGVTHHDRLALSLDHQGKQLERITSSRKSSDNAYIQLQTEQIAYNAFGDITVKGTQGGNQRRIDYDTAGRVWRTNDTAKGAATVYYYDANGNATLEVTSSQVDLMSSAVLAGPDSANLRTLMQNHQVAAKFNVFDALNRLTDSYQAPMNGVKEGASLTASTKTIQTSIVQEPFEAGAASFYSGNLSVESDLESYWPPGWFGPDDFVSEVRRHYVRYSLPTGTVYGSHAYRLESTLTFVYEYPLVVGGDAPSGPNGPQVVESKINRYVSGGSGTLNGGEFWISSRAGWSMRAETKIFQQSIYGETLLASEVRSYGTSYWSGASSETLVERPLQIAKNNYLPQGLGINLGGATLETHELKSAEGTYPANPSLIKTGGGNLYLFNINSLQYNVDYSLKYSAVSGGIKTIDAIITFRKNSGGWYISSTTRTPREPIVQISYENYINWKIADGVGFESLVHTSSRYNAFGELIAKAERKTAGSTAEEIWTEFDYNALGKLIQKKDPKISITHANGTRELVNPITEYHYDAEGRLIGTRDANQNLTTYRLQAGSTVEHSIVLDEFHADRTLGTNAAQQVVAGKGVKRQRYDVFGQLKRSVNENWDGTGDQPPFAITYGYNKNGELTSIDRPGAADENYTVDSQGQRIATLLAPSAQDNGTRYSEKTHYDALGRVVKTVSAGGRVTSYSYEWVAAIVGGGGWRRRTTTADGTLIDDIDTFDRLRWHRDLGNRAITYRYNGAGLLISQTSLSTDVAPTDLRDSEQTLVHSGQNISFSYYDNGLLKDTVDHARKSWTKYRYDERGNRVFEGYARNLGTDESPAWEYYQYSEAEYDDAGRLKRVWDPKSDINYEYDAVGNRRRVVSTYHDGANGGLQTQDHWYTYDNMNRFLVTMGTLDAGLGVIRGAHGKVMTYDHAGQRKSANTADGLETYSYDAEGFLEEVKFDGARIAFRENDARGNVVRLEETTRSTGDITRHFYRYEADNILEADHESVKKANSDTYVSTSYTSMSLSASGAVNGSTRTQYKDNGYDVSNTITTTYQYTLWDERKQSSIEVKGTVPYKTGQPWDPGSTTLTYDVNGHIERTYDRHGNRHFYYSTDADGRVLRREELDNADIKPSRQNRVAAERSALFFQNYYFFNGREVGTVSNDPAAIRKDYSAALANGTSTKLYERRVVLSADFDQNYQPVGTNYPARTSSTYTVMSAGESLQSIALAVWGDGSLWYLIAEANGLRSTDQLEQGQRLVIPNKVTNIHNNTNTFRPYDAGQALGDIQPTLPDAPPPATKKGKCGGLGPVLMIVVAIAVAAFAGPALVGVLGQVGAGAAAGALGSIASQAVGMVTGDVQKFSWSSVAKSAIAGGIGAAVNGIGEGSQGFLSEKLGIAGKGFTDVVLRSAVSNTLTQGASIAVGLQKRFDWRGVAASAASAAISYGVQDSSIGRALSSHGPAGAVVRDTAAGVISGAAIAKAMGQRPQWAQIAASSFGEALGGVIRPAANRLGSALGDAVVGSIARGDGDRGQAKQDARKSQEVGLSRDQEDRIRTGQTVTDFGDPYADGDGDMAGSTGAVRRNGRARLILGDDGPLKSSKELEWEAFKAKAQGIISDHGVLGTPAAGVDQSATPLTDVQRQAFDLGGGPLNPEAAQRYLQAYGIGQMLGGEAPPMGAGVPIGGNDGPSISYDSNPLGQGVGGLWDSSQRIFGYDPANRSASRSALATIAEAAADGNLSKARDAAYAASEQRNINRENTRARMTPGGAAISEAIDQTKAPSYYEELARSRLAKAGDTNQFKVYEKMAEGAAKSRPSANLLSFGGAALGTISLAYGGYESYKAISSATDKPYATAVEAGGWLGGLTFGTYGTVGAMSLAVALGSNPVGWGVAGIGIAGGAVSGYFGSKGGKWAADFTYQGVKSWWKNGGTNISVGKDEGGW